MCAPPATSSRRSCSTPVRTKPRSPPLPCPVASLVTATIATHPTDAMLGTALRSVCTNCHTPGDPGYQAAEKMQEELSQLQQSVLGSDEILNRAESSGMEVSQARLEQDQARDNLTKARVTIHTFNPASVEQDTQAGLKITDKTYQEGQRAMAERNYRRIGLGVSLLTIIVVLGGMRLYLAQIEQHEHY